MQYPDNPHLRFRNPIKDAVAAMLQRADAVAQFRRALSNQWMAAKQVEQLSKTAHISGCNLIAELLTAKGIDCFKLGNSSAAKPQLYGFLFAFLR